MALPALTHCSNSSLFSTLAELTTRERESVADIVLHLAEIDERGIYRDAGYSSLFSYCHEGLGYSEGSANRRVRAARALKSSPEIYEMLKTGKLTLCALSQVTPVMNDTNREEVLAATSGASKREAERLAVHFGAPVRAKQEQIRPRKVAVSAAKPAVVPLFDSVAAVDMESMASNQREKVSEVESEERFSFTFEVSKEVYDLYQKAQTLVGPCSAAELFEMGLRRVIKDKTPKAPILKKSKAVESRTSPVAAGLTQDKKPKRQSRVVSRPIRRAVVERDLNRCSYVSPDGKRCSERHRLEIDHIHPISLGGGNELNNLRLLCKAHNQLAAERVYGRKFMEAKRRRLPALKAST